MHLFRVHYIKPIPYKIHEFLLSYSSHEKRRVCSSSFRQTTCISCWLNGIISLCQHTQNCYRRRHQLDETRLEMLTQRPCFTWWSTVLIRRDDPRRLCWKTLQLMKQKSEQVRKRNCLILFLHNIPACLSCAQPNPIPRRQSTPVTDTHEYIRPTNTEYSMKSWRELNKWAAEKATLALFHPRRRCVVVVGNFTSADFLLPACLLSSERNEWVAVHYKSGRTNERVADISWPTNTDQWKCVYNTRNTVGCLFSLLLLVLYCEFVGDSDRNIRILWIVGKQWIATKQRRTRTSNSNRGMDKCWTMLRSNPRYRASWVQTRAGR